MATRSFQVFQDAPSNSEASTSVPKVARAASGVLVSRSGSLVNVKSVSDSKAVIDKENFNPATGEHSNTSVSVDKKRKTTVLATKVVTTSSKALKEKPGPPEPKKRKTALNSKKKKSASSKKDGKSTSTATRKSKRSTPSPRVSPMPKLVEEETSAETESGRQGISQVDIDARCYELTVKPLADVSDAYEVPASPTESLNGAKNTFRMIKANSVEPELRDYFSPTNSGLSLGRSRLDLFAEENNATSHVFSTPERKKIYSSFTFSSPSPSSKRFRDVFTRSGSPTPSTTAAPSPVASMAADHDS